MTPEAFRQWREQLGLNRGQAADALQIGRNMPQRYEEGESEIPYSIQLACDAVARNLRLHPDYIEVFSFLVYDAATDETTKPPSKRDADFIRNVAKGEVIDGTGQIVHRSKLDPYGRFYPETERIAATTMIVDKVAHDLSRGDAAISDPAFLAMLGTCPAHLLKPAIQEQLHKVSPHLDLDNVETLNLRKYGGLTIHWHHAAGGEPPRRTEVNLPRWVR